MVCLGEHLDINGITKILGPRKNIVKRSSETSTQEF
jgi:hypothetical protein